MKKSTLTPAILVLSMMLSPSSANAFWLDIVKEFVSGTIKTIAMPKAAKNLSAAAEDKPAPPAPTTVQIPQSGTPHSPEDIFAALSKLENICMQEFANNIPCAIGMEKSFSIGTAREKAAAKARIELANSMGTYINANAKLDSKSEEDGEGILSEANAYIAEAKLTTRQLVSGAQQYLSYTYIDEEATELNKGRTVYMTTVVMVMNKELFGKALEDAAKGNPLGSQIIRESRKGIVSVVRTALKRM
jgi:hypothetical protein